MKSLIAGNKCLICGKRIVKSNKYGKRIYSLKFCSRRCANQKPNSSRFKKGIHYNPNSEFQKGLIPWNKGKKAPQISEALKLKHKALSNQRRKKALPNGSFYGRHHTEESKQKMRGHRPNMIPWDKDVKRPEISKLFKDKPQSLEHRKKLSEASKKRLANPKNHPMWKGNEYTVNRICSECGKVFRIRLTKGIKGKFCSSRCRNLNNLKMIEQLSPTSIEKKLYDELKRRGLLFETQKIINGKFIVDAYIPSLNLIVEADGDYWHNLDRIAKKDKAENAYLTKCGYNLLRLSETEINKDVEKAINKIFS